MARGAGAALHGDAVGLVQNQDAFVLEQDHPLDEVAVALGEPERRHHRRPRLRRLADHGRHAHLLPGFDAGIGLHAFAVDTHLAGAQQFLQVAVADVGKMHAKPAVEAQAALAARNLDGLDRRAHVSSQRVSHSPAYRARIESITEPIR